MLSKYRATLAHYRSAAATAENFSSETTCGKENDRGLTASHTIPVRSQDPYMPEISCLAVLEAMDHRLGRPLFALATQHAKLAHDLDALWPTADCL